MAYKENICKHLNEIIDVHDGTTICTDCGLVIYESMFIEKDYGKKELYTCNDIEEIKELLERLNFPTSFAYDIFENVKKSLESHKSIKKYLIPFIIYQTLNEKGYPISIKDISSVCGISDNYIYDMQKNSQSIILNHHSLLEKYCSILKLNYKTYTVIKELIPNLNTGHNPLTVIAATIYRYCKENKIKYSMKYIANTIGISPVSIQRYIRKC
jgi:transcription initiation factor TFIIIB Brf1 subunit/transcription initiation factor TFIIB